MITERERERHLREHRQWSVTGGRDSFTAMMPSPSLSWMRSEPQKKRLGVADSALQGVGGKVWVEAGVGVAEVGVSVDVAQSSPRCRRPPCRSSVERAGGRGGLSGWAGAGLGGWWVGEGVIHSPPRCRRPACRRSSARP